MAGERTPDGAECVVVADADAVATATAERIAATLAETVSARGRADWATTGGSLAPAIYRKLAGEPLRDLVPWASVHVWWGDDRYVPRDHPLSNVKPLDDILASIGWTEGGFDNLHPFPTTSAIGHARGAAWCAATLGAELAAAGLDRVDGWPVFDLVLVGVGPDGHVLSVFPGSAAFDSPELALAIPAPTHVEPHVERVTINPALLGVARRVLVAAAGAGKARVLADIFATGADPRRWPARLVVRDGATWVLDSAAAERLGG